MTNASRRKASKLRRKNRKINAVKPGIVPQIIPNIKVLAASGFKHCGKSTAMKALKDILETQGKTVYVISFAGTLKKIAEAFGFTLDSLYGTPEQKAAMTHLGVSGREFLQQTGTELYRNHFSKAVPNFAFVKGCSVWASLLYHRLSVLPKDTIVLIDDLRFVDEAEMLKAIGATILSINGGQSAPVVPGVVLHESERWIPTIAKNYSDYVVENNAGINDFKNQVIGLFAETLAA